MEEWRTYKFKDVTTKIGSGATPSGGKESYLGGDIALVRSQNVLDLSFSCEGLAYISDEQARKLSNVELCSNDTLINITGDSVARVCTVPSWVLPARVNQHVAIVRPDSSKVANKYLTYYLLTQKDFLMSISASGATRKALTKAMLEDLDILLPPLEYQKKVVSILSSFDEKIELNNRINHNLEEQLSSKYESLLSNSSHRVNLSIFANKISDGVHNTVIDSADGTFNLLSCKNLKDGRVVINDVERKISKETFQILRRRTQLEQWDILLSSVGTIGEIVLLKEDPSKYEFQRSVAMIKACDKQDACIIYSALKRQKNELIHSAHGAVQQCLFLSDIKGFEIEVPAKRNIIDEFGKYAIAVHNVIAKNQKESIGLGMLRDSLLPHLMSGELNINEFDC